MNEIQGLKSIFEIKDYKFIIKNYQRGYRWDKKQVENLLDDLLEFNKKSENELYCLQPIIVRKLQENEYELIDGQQRLTTIFIILKFLEEKEYLYKIKYDIREKSEEFLEKIATKSDKESNNLDFIFMKNAYNTIKEWFKQVSEREKNGDLKGDFRRLLLGNQKNVKFIWYEIKDKDLSSEEVFSRINIGKIALNDAELIKAKLLFDLKTDKKEEKYLRQLEIGNEWDIIEKDLQNEAFWRFLVNSKLEKENRIEYIFDYVSDKKNEDTEYYTFDKISEMINEQLKEDKNWNENEKKFWNENVKKYYYIFKEWYKDTELYNFIGFLNFYNIEKGNTYNLIKEYQNCSEKIEFRKKVKDIVISDVKDSIANIDTLEYGSDDKELKKLFILFNIITMNKLNQKFPFEKYKKEEWSLEHIHPRNIKNMGNDKEKWKTLCEDEMKTIKDFIEHFKNNPEKYSLYNKILDQMEKLKNTIDVKKENDIQNEFEQISSLMKEEYGKEYLNTIANLTLLDKNTNSKIGNNYFDTKRRKIINLLEETNTFIPICTKNVFLKFYSKKPNHVYFWTDDDRKDYKEKIEEVLQQFVGSESE